MIALGLAAGALLPVAVVALGVPREVALRLQFVLATPDLGAYAAPSNDPAHRPANTADTWTFPTLGSPTDRILASTDR